MSNVQTIVCTDCHEGNPLTADRCVRCGRSLEDARREQTRVHFEWQHSDAPNTIVRRDVKTPSDRKRVW